MKKCSKEAKAIGEPANKVWGAYAPLENDPGKAGRQKEYNNANSNIRKKAIEKQTKIKEPAKTAIKAPAKAKKTLRDSKQQR